MKVNAILIALCAANALAYPTASKKSVAITAIDTTGHVGIDVKSGQETASPHPALRRSTNDDDMTNGKLDQIGNQLNEQLNAFALALERLKRCAARASSEQQSVIHRMQEHHEDEDEDDEDDNEDGSTEELLHVISDSIALLNTARDYAFHNSHPYTNKAEPFPSPEPEDSESERDHKDVVLKDLFYKSPPPPPTALIRQISQNAPSVTNEAVELKRRTVAAEGELK